MALIKTQYELFQEFLSSQSVRYTIEESSSNEWYGTKTIRILNDHILSSGICHLDFDADTGDFIGIEAE